jgi:hypothetical protein
VTCDQIEESGAYVLGILDAQEQIAYERHLDRCEICRQEVAGFSGLPDLLGQLSLDDVQSIALSPDEVEEIARDIGPDPEYGRREAPVPLRPLPSVPRSNPVEQGRPYGGSRPQQRGPQQRGPQQRGPRQRGPQRRSGRWRTVTAGLAAAACLAIGVLVGARFIAPDPAPPAPQMVAMRPVADSVPITAQVALTRFAGGTEVRMHCSYNGGAPGPRWALKMFVYPKNGDAPEQLSTWTAAHGDDVTLAAATRFAPAEIGKVEIRRGDATSLLVYEQA